MSEKADRPQLLRDPGIEPTIEVIASGLGATYETYVKFVGELENRYGITLMAWRFYNDGKAWLSKGEYKWTTPRGAHKAKPIFWLSIWEGFFKVSFNFSVDVQEELLGLPVSQETKDIIISANPMGNTARFIPLIMDIDNNRQLSDVYLIAEFRKIRIR